MKVHLVGGFLGSGKTTAITNVCKDLSDKGIKTSIITNDQGKYLVDSEYVKQAGVSHAEVTGGCFCCNYNQFESEISSLKNDFDPSAIFAEFVGSCTDLVATVVRPLIKFKGEELEQVSFSTFVDAQLLLMYIRDEDMPFGFETTYIWEKQIEEAGILIVNKIDLLSPQESKELQESVKEMYSDKQVLFQNSLDLDSINNWIELINAPQKNDFKELEIDYDTYGVGEANLAWLDEEIEIKTTNEKAVEYTYDFIKSLSDDIVDKKLAIGHVKFFMFYNDKSLKLSYTTILDKSIDIPEVFEKSNSVKLLINARVETKPTLLKDILFEKLNMLKLKETVQIEEKFLSYFQPGYPKPTHRLVC